ncbi:BREX-2 system adenine-specific DNA-methyltransferase PglX [Kocuria turfanensis]|uniref:site-specific DNA-methyltransferase (adenine-specific) n=1 Tax=Kocuria turfanensis TaxID=388357 RepID=A0A512IH07_9MICC|nr:BREX-2 system adenine-specific DNA-methyltransferase PglX [Kocuria turfanensis]GEO96993.1 DNA methylase [Kocuria turfanensis]
MTATPQLTTDLQKLVLEVEDDLRARLEADPDRSRDWHEEHRQAMRARRTAMAWTTWRDDRIVQAAVSWVLTTVFVRFAEDNELVAPTWFTGPGERRHHAVEAQLAFFRERPVLTDREWIEDAFEHLRSHPATAGLVDDHAGLRLISPSGQMATRIIEFWRRLDDDGAVVHDLADPELSTRFLGDLYQDLSEHARETFALLQTPEFVEEFILDQTLTPALEERPLEGFKLIDPTCGSGHFLLGAFTRFNDLWAQKAPSMGARERVQKALESVYGVDINAFAVAVARFRLTIAAMQACGERSLDTADAFDIHVETGDSLIHGKAPDMLEGFSDGTGADLFAYATEDQQALKEILAPGQYDVVVGNPPYITVKDKTLNERYRELYRTCKGKYAMTVPFMERFFELAKRSSSHQPAGWTGQITSNSFMKREFGSKIIEDFLSQLDLRSVIDTSGAYIPGHGTPTVILVGRNDQPQSGTVRAVLGIRGEPGRPADASRGLVWSSISGHVHEPGYEDEWVSVVDLERQVLAAHPWSLTGGSAPAVAGRIEVARHSNLGDITYRIGVFGIMGADDAMMLEDGVAERTGRETSAVSALVVGDKVRDFSVTETYPTWFPYTENHALRRIDEFPGWGRHLWRVRTELGNRATFSKQTYFAEGRPFYEWHQLPKDIGASKLTLTFAFVATHNHFVLDRGGKVFKQSAPVIKLPEGATEEEHLALLGVLNSSVACFWLKQNSHNKGGPGGGSSKDEKWRDFYEFTGTVLRGLPLPGRLDIEMPRKLDACAAELAKHSPEAVARAGVPSRALMDRARECEREIRGRMVFLQEELDWFYYRAFGLIDEDLNYYGCAQCVRVGGRPFEEALRHRVRDHGYVTRWFTEFAEVDRLDRGDSEEYGHVVNRRLDVINSNPLVRWLESPDFKRPWSAETWEKRERLALRGWLLDRIEARGHWFDRQGRPSVRSIGQLADALGRDEDFVSVLELWAGQRDVDLVATLTKLLTDEAVPYLAAWRLKEPALRKWEAWKATWDLQRREDKGEKVGQIPVPPKYTTADFRKQSYWSHRGKLDVPKERFISYPGAELSTDRSMLLGWAGWNHAEQFLALASHMDRMIADGAEDDRLVPVLAGLHELLPWVQQWHAELDPAYGVSLGDFAAQEVEQRRARLAVALDDLVAWRPPKATRGRKKAS